MRSRSVAKSARDDLLRRMPEMSVNRSSRADMSARADMLARATVGAAAAGRSPRRTAAGSVAQRGGEVRARPRRRRRRSRGEAVGRRSPRYDRAVGQVCGELGRPCRTGRSAPARPRSASGVGDQPQLGRPGLVRAVGIPGGCSGNDRQRTASAPRTAAVRQATRAPALRPPTTSGPRQSPARRPDPQRLHQRHPRLVERRRRRGHPPAGDPPGLLDQRDAPSPPRRAADTAAVEVDRPSPPPAPWPRSDRPACARAGRRTCDPRRAARGRDLDHDRACTRAGRHRAPMTSPVIGSTTPSSSSAASGSSRSGPLLRVEFDRGRDRVGLEPARAARRPAAADGRPRRSAGSSQAAQSARSSTSGCRSWIRSRPGSASVVMIVNVVSQASGSSASGDRLVAPELVEPGEGHDVAVGAVHEERLLARLALGVHRGRATSATRTSPRPARGSAGTRRPA